MVGETETPTCKKGDYVVPNPLARRYDAGMESYSFRSIWRIAVKETLEAIRLDKPVRWVVAISTLLLGGGISWLLTKQVSYTAIAGFAALLLVGVIIFLSKMITVPLAVAAKTDRDRRDAESSLGTRIAALEAQQADARDPDAIYQLGRRAATVLHPTVILNAGVIHFAELRGAVDLNVAEEFEYRDFVLRLQAADNKYGAGMGNVIDVTIAGVTCRIVRTRA